LTFCRERTYQSVNPQGGTDGIEVRKFDGGISIITELELSSSANTANIDLNVVKAVIVHHFAVDNNRLILLHEAKNQ
jgi:hypothetical protein